MRPIAPIHIGQLANDKQFKDSIHKILDGNVEYGDGVNSGNIAGNWITVTSPGVANTEFSFAHKLNKVPVGYHIMRRNNTGVIYDGTTAWTSSLIYLKCTVATQAMTIFVF